MDEKNELTLSSLGHTWIIDLDGTIVKHNGYLIDGKDTLLPGASDFLKSIPQDDAIIFLTSRNSKYEEITKEFLRQENINYQMIIFNAPYGERIVINDKKDSGLETAKSINLQRNSIVNIKISINYDL